MLLQYIYYDYYYVLLFHGIVLNTWIIKQLESLSVSLFSLRLHKNLLLIFQHELLPSTVQLHSFSSHCPSYWEEWDLYHSICTQWTCLSACKICSALFIHFGYISSYIIPVLGLLLTEPLAWFLPVGSYYFTYNYKVVGFPVLRYHRKQYGKELNII